MKAIWNDFQEEKECEQDFSERIVSVTEGKKERTVPFGENL